jgi:L-ascorbate metabolism protein UlaG (beta-lactamase superfamily)
MKLTKYEHGCFVIERDGQKLVIDPGGWTPSLPTETNVVAVVATHMHDDHLDPVQLARLISANPELTLYAPADALSDVTTDRKVAVAPGQQITIGGFKLDFIGSGHHAPIDVDSPCQNVGVIVNDAFYDPGDSFDPPSSSVRVVAVPISGPWMKAGEAMDYIRQIKAPLFVATHDALLSPQGHKTYGAWLEAAATEAGSKYQDLPVGGTVEISL